MKKVLITGICGFAGSALRSELESCGYDVYGADIVSFDDKVFKVDLIDKKACFDLINKVRPDIIFNLAGQASPQVSWQDINLTMHINVDLSVNIAEAVLKYVPEARILFIGSANQYDISKAPGGLVSEDNPKVNDSPYSVSKNTQEDILMLMHKKYGLDLCITRSFNHIGPNQKIGFVVTDYANRIALIEKGELDTFRYGNLDSWRDFSDVRDVVRAYRLIAEKGRSGEIYNVGSGKSYYIRDIIGSMVERSPLTMERTVLPPRLPDDALIHSRADISKLQADTGFEPLYDAAETALAVLQSYRDKVIG